MTKNTMTILEVLRAAAETPYPTDSAWPYLGKLVPDAASRIGASGPENPDPSSTVVTVYATACDGLRRLAQPAAWSICKVGVTAGQLRQRLRWMGQDRYGSSYRLSDGQVVSEDGFTDWLAQHLPVELNLDPGSCVTPVGRGLQVRLPGSLSVRAFDRALSDALEAMAVDRVMATPAGAARCEAFGLDPVRYRRLTAYDFAGQPRISRAREIVFFRPRLDTMALIRVIEVIVAAHLAGLPSILQRAA